MGTFHDGDDLSGMAVGYHTASWAVTDTGSYLGTIVVVVVVFFGTTFGTVVVGV